MSFSPWLLLSLIREEDSSVLFSPFSQGANKFVRSLLAKDLMWIENLRKIPSGGWLIPTGRESRRKSRVEIVLSRQLQLKRKMSDHLVLLVGWFLSSIIKWRKHIQRAKWLIKSFGRKDALLLKGFGHVDYCQHFGRKYGTRTFSYRNKNKENVWD